MFPKEVKQADITAKVIESEESDGDNDFAAEKNLAKQLAGTWVVNDDLNFLTKYGDILRELLVALFHQEAHCWVMKCLMNSFSSKVN